MCLSSRSLLYSCWCYFRILTASVVMVTAVCIDSPAAVFFRKVKKTPLTLWLISSLSISGSLLVQLWLSILFHDYETDMPGNGAVIKNIEIVWSYLETSQVITVLHPKISKTQIFQYTVCREEYARVWDTDVSLSVRCELFVFVFYERRPAVRRTRSQLLLGKWRLFFVRFKNVFAYEFWTVGNYEHVYDKCMLYWTYQFFYTNYWKIVRHFSEIYT